MDRTGQVWHPIGIPRGLARTASALADKAPTVCKNSLRELKGISSFSTPMIIEAGMQKSDSSPFPILTEQEYRDPVCGMTVTKSKAAGHVEYGGKDYYFCAASCAAKFKADPEK